MEGLIAKRDAAYRAYCKAHEKHLREHSYESEAHMQAMRKVWRGAEKLLADAYARMGQAKTLKEG